MMIELKTLLNTSQMLEQKLNKSQVTRVVCAIVILVLIIQKICILSSETTRTISTSSGSPDISRTPDVQHGQLEIPQDSSGSPEIYRTPDVQHGQLEIPQASSGSPEMSRTPDVQHGQPVFNRSVVNHNTSLTPYINKTALVNPTAMVFILSSREYVKSRKVYRNILSGSGVGFMFVVGTCCPIPIQLRHIYTCESNIAQTNTSNKYHLARSVQCDTEDAQIAFESMIYKDILITNKTDVYRHLPAKVRLMLHWGVQNTKFDFFVKVDQDHFINPIALIKLVASRSQQEYSIICHVASGFDVLRDGKWKELTYQHGVKNAKYPDFPLGSRGWIMSRKVAKYISQHRLKLLDYQGEDVSIGIWLHESSIASDIQWISSKQMRGDGDCSDPNDIVVGHELSPEKIQHCWDTHKNKTL